MEETLAGLIETVTYHNPENGFVVLRVKVKKQRGLATVVGEAAKATPGEHIEATGKWVNDSKHGMQFKADELRITVPNSIEGIEKYLASGLIRGIGAHAAKKIVEVFGDRALSVIDESPTYLREIKGIGAKRIQMIRESWAEQKHVRDIMLFLQTHGIGTARAVRIYKVYGDKAIDIIRSNPYRLAEDIWGVGFQTADELALRLGIDRLSPLRARAAIFYVLQELSSNGHCGYPEAGVLERTAQLTEIPLENIQTAAHTLIANKDLIRESWSSPTPRPAYADEPWLYLKQYYRAEVGVAHFLRELCKGGHPLPKIDLDKAFVWIEKRMRLTLAASQRQAIQQAVTSKVLVITGGPGVGKSTIVRGILEIFLAKDLKCKLCAPTGRAAKRLAETTGREAKTIHRLLETDDTGHFTHNEDHKLKLDLLIVDESSMIDVSLMNHLLRALPAEACLLLVGDVDQLPSVGPGCVLGDIIASKVVPVARLTEIFRQAEDSGIVRAAHQVHRGAMPQSAPPDRLGDFYFIDVEAPPTIVERMLTLIRERIPARFGFDPLNDVQVLTPMNRAELGVRTLNAQLQEMLNPPIDGPEIERFGWKFRLGDKVLQTVNNYDKDVFNGDIGRIVAIHKEEQEVLIDFDGREVEYDFEELEEIALAYAMTIHKSQGSEYPAVVIILHTQHYVMLQRNLLYTAITRGKKLVVVVGSRRALRLAVERHDTAKRFTGLRWRLEGS